MFASYACEVGQPVRLRRTPGNGQRPNVEQSNEAQACLLQSSEPDRQELLTQKLREDSFPLGRR